MIVLVALLLLIVAAIGALCGYFMGLRRGMLAMAVPVVMLLVAACALVPWQSPALLAVVIMSAVIAIAAGVGVGAGALLQRRPG
jgi:hypothetical protein